MKGSVRTRVEPLVRLGWSNSEEAQAYVTSAAVHGKGVFADTRHVRAFGVPPLPHTPWRLAARDELDAAPPRTTAADAFGPRATMAKDARGSAGALTRVASDRAFGVADALDFNPSALGERQASVAARDYQFSSAKAALRTPTVTAPRSTLTLGDSSGRAFARRADTTNAAAYTPPAADPLSARLARAQLARRAGSGVTDPFGRLDAGATQSYETSSGRAYVAPSGTHRWYSPAPGPNAPGRVADALSSNDGAAVRADAFRTTTRDAFERAPGAGGRPAVAYTAEMFDTFGVPARTAGARAAESSSAARSRSSGLSSAAMVASRSLGEGGGAHARSPPWARARH